jgi:hypothetical protein
MKTYEDIIKEHSTIYDENSYIECDLGWAELIDDLSNTLVYLSNSTKTNIKVTQVKEKFGILRFHAYISGDDETAIKLTNDVIHKAETDSGHICEHCGRESVLIKPKSYRGWLKTLCEFCEKGI